MRSPGALNAVTTGNFAGSIEVTYDEDALVESFNRLFDPYAAEADADRSSSAGVGMMKSFELNYVVQVAENGNAFHYSINGNIDGKVIDLGELFFDTQKGCYISKQTILGLFDFAKAVDTDHQDSYYYSATFRRSLEQSLGNNDSIMLANSAELSEITDIIANYQELTQKNQSLHESIIAFITTAFRDFSPHHIKKIKGGYELSLTVEDAINAIIDGLDYILDHNGEFYGALETLINAIPDDFYLSDLFYSDDGEANDETMRPFAFSDEQRKDWNVVFIELSAYLKMNRENGSFDDIKNTAYNVKLTKDHDIFQSHTEFSSIFEGDPLLNIKSSSTIIPGQAKIDFPEDATSMQMIENQLDELLYASRPITQLTFYYSKDDFYDEDVNSYYPGADEAWMDASTIDRVPFWMNDSDYSERVLYYTESAQFYVPLYVICEPFNEEYGWNQETKQAYVLHGGEQIFMDGFVKSDTFFVKARDFEKLGYTIDDEADDEMRIITITRN